MKATAGTPEPSVILLDTQLREAVIASSLDCRGCGYDVQGLPADGACPECGMPLAETIMSLVDPAASRLPRLSNPRAVGTHLFGATACLAGSALLLLAESLWSWAGVAPTRVPMLGADLPRDLPILAAAVAVFAVWPSLRLLPPAGSEPSVAVQRDVWLLALGTLAWTGAAAVLPWSRRAGDWATTSLQMGLVLAAAIALAGIGGILGTVGKRSRAYRRSRAGRQSAQAMIAAVAGAGVGVLLRSQWTRWSLPEDLKVLTSVMISVCCLMAAIGLPYMVLNSWWIRSALHRPPPSLDQLLLPRLPADARVPDEASEDTDA